MPYRIHPDDEIDGARLEAISSAMIRHKATVDNSTYAILRHGLRPEEYAPVKACRDHLIATTIPGSTSAYELHPRFCRKTLHCPHCSDMDFAARVKFILRRLASLNTAVPEDDAAPPHAALYHVIVTSPPFLRPLLAKHEGMRGFFNANVRAIAAGFGFTTDHEVKEFYKTRGVFGHLHPWGNSDLFDGWSPHYDNIVTGYDADGKYGPREWPQPYEKSRAILRDSLRTELKPWLPVLPIDLFERVRDELESNFRVNFRVVVKPEEGWARPRALFLPEEAPALVRYSARPFVEPCRIRGTRDDARRPLLAYTPLGNKGRSYFAPPKQFFDRVRVMKDFLEGSKIARREHGVVHGQHYKNHMITLGRKGVPRTPKSKRRMVGTYYRRGPDDYVYLKRRAPENDAEG